MKVIAVNGSARKNGNTGILLNTVFSELNNEGIDTEVINLAGHVIQGCRACGACKKTKNNKCIFDNDITNEIIEKMVEADGVILASPTYFADVSAEMKAIIDRVGYVARANGNLLKRKPCASVVAVRRAGSLRTFDSMNALFLIGEAIIVGSDYWNLGIGRDRGDVEGDEEGLQTMKCLGQNMAWLLKKLG